MREKISIVILLAAALYCVPVSIAVINGIDLPDSVIAFWIVSLPITIIGLPPYLFRFLKIRIVAMIEARDFAEGGTLDVRGQDPLARKVFPFPVFAVITAVLTGLALVAWQQQSWLLQLPLPWSEQSLDEPTRIGLFFWVVLILWVAISFVGFLEHVRPYGNRRHTHDYALALTGTLFSFGLAGMALFDMHQGTWQPWIAQLPFLLLDQAQGVPKEMNLFFWIFLGLLIALFFLAFREHIRPFGNRRRKYDYALALTSTIWLGHCLFLGSLKTLVYQPVLTLALALVTSFLMRLICKPTDNPGTAARHVHRWFKVLVDWPAVVVLAAWFPVALAVVLVMRYRCVQWMTNCPIVYLRSFSQENAPRVFQKVITEPANRYGVLVALVHKTQSASDLQASSDMLEGSQFSGSSDDNWQTWVANEIARASAVIIDCSIATEGVRWETQRAMKNTDPDRIALLAQHDSSLEAPASAKVIRYEDSKDGFEAARSEFDDWIYDRVLS